jgi:glutamate formiminotransferase/formiminotetrahydrofolate cyclodeaminase
MTPLIECVPNFSEGRNRATIDAIATAISSTTGVSLLDVDPGADTHRTVMTFVGPPDAVAEAAFRAIQVAAERIDMQSHRGAHPRLGATDVCPFVPLQGATMADCVALARELGERVGGTLAIPVYLYEQAATSPARHNLAAIREGEYEGLAQKLAHPEWRPDFGPARPNLKSGATVIGAREFLIAYNVNLNTEDRALAHDIALSIREAGRAQRDERGEIKRDAAGKAINQPGLLKAVKAVGWTIPEHQLAQVSINLVDFKVTPPHVAFEAVRKEARARGLRVTGSELVGLIPLDAMLSAGKYYLEAQGKSPGAPEAEIVRIAVQSLGLSDLAPFDPRKKIIEYRVATPGAQRLAGLSLREFVDELSTDHPAPGGGSAAALMGALAAALAAMVANLTVGKKGFEQVAPEMKALAVAAQGHKDFFLAAVDRDTQAFEQLMAAYRLPAATDTNRAAKSQAVTQAVRGATAVPRSVLERIRPVIALCRAAAERGNPNAQSDAGVAAAAARAAARGAYWNVLINLKSIAQPADRRSADSEWAESEAAGAAETLATIEREVRTLEDFLADRLARTTPAPQPT